MYFDLKEAVGGQTPAVTHLLLVLPPRASRSAASRGPARARWSVWRWTGSSLNAIHREAASSLRSHRRIRRIRCPPPRRSSFSPAGLRSSADATRADEPRSTARVCGGCMLCHRAGVKAGQLAASTSSRTELVFSCCSTCGCATPLIRFFFEPWNVSARPPFSLSPALYCIIHYRVTWCGVYIIFSQKGAALVNSSIPLFLVWPEGPNLIWYYDIYYSIIYYL